MALVLLQKQKKILDEYFEKNKDNIGVFWEPDELPQDVWDQLVAIKDSEILYHLIRAYVTDKVGKQTR
jgi:hypothetical protein